MFLSKVLVKLFDAVELSSNAVRLSISKNLVRPGPVSSANCLTLPMMSPVPNSSRPGGKLPEIS